MHTLTKNNMARIALEFVPPNIEEGPEGVIEDVRKVQERSKEFGIDGLINHLMIPGMIEEDGDRPVPMREKIDPLEVWKTAAPELPDMTGMCTQVTAFHNEIQLKKRFRDLQNAGMEHVIFVGVPRTMQDGEGSGVPPTDALANFQAEVSSRGVILIPTREGEDGRFNFKCEQGATFALSQLLFSDSMVHFLRDFSKNHSHRPEILLSFGFVPKAEKNAGLINWLIQDNGNKTVQEEQRYVAKLTELSLKEKQKKLLNLYKSVIDGLSELDFPMSIHLEAPYGFSKPAFETFAMMLDYWKPNS
jgi:hypothetical protein